MLIDVLPIARLPRSVGPLTYSVNDAGTNPAENIRTGAWVRVPFRKGTVDAIVYRTHHTPPIPVSRIRECTDVLAVPAVSARQLGFAEFFARTYSISLSHSLYCFLPDRPKRKSGQISSQSPRIQEQYTIGAGRQKVLSDMVDQSVRGAATTVFFPTATRSESVALWMIAASKIHTGQMLIIVPTIFRLRELSAVLAKRFPQRVIALDPDDGIEAYWTAWQSARENDDAIILATKRGLLAPAENIKFVCLDTETDSSHRQNEQNPRYHTRTAAAYLAQLHKARFFAADAVPSLTFVRQKNVHIFPPSQERRTRLVANLAHERASRNFSPLANSVVTHLAQHREPTLLFLNRKGAARIYRCWDCSWTLTCPTCSAALVLHADGHSVCHHCKTKTIAPLSCPSCLGTALKSSGIGTEQVERFCSTTFPDRATSRIDSESSSVQGKPDLIIATEKILTTGNLPEFSTVVFVLLDQLFHVPDYRGYENALQLAERVIQLSATASTVVFQTYSPDHSVVRALQKHSYETLYAQESALRRQLLLPPVAHIVLLRGKGKPYELLAEGNAMKDTLQAALHPKNIRVECPLTGKDKSVGMIVRLLPEVRQLGTLQSFLHTLPDHWIVDPDPDTLLV